MHEDLLNTPAGHPDFAPNHFKLGKALRKRYRASNNVDDLEASVQSLQIAVEHTPDGCPDKILYLHSLGASISGRYRRLGNPEDLEKALETKMKAVEHTPRNDTSWAAHVGGLVETLLDRYRSHGTSDDLDSALLYSQEIVDHTSKDHPDRAHYLNSRAACVSDRYRRSGDLEDLDAALGHCKEAVDLTPEGHPDRATYLSSLAVCLTDRYRKLGNLKDLDMSLNLRQEAVDIIPDTHRGKPGHLQSLCVSLSDRYRRLGQISDLDKALVHGRAAVDLTPVEHPDRAQFLESAAVCHLDRYRKLGDVDDLDISLKYRKEIVHLTPKVDYFMAHRLHLLAVVFSDRYDKVGDLNDLDQVVHYLKEAVDLTPEDHPDRAPRLQGLGRSFALRYRRLKDPNDLQDVHTHYGASLALSSSYPDESWKVALRWASFAAIFQPSYSRIAFKAAFRLLPELLWIGNSISSRHDTIRWLNIGKATSTATRSMINLGDFGAAVEILEQGLATVFQQTLQLKTEVEGLQPDQAKEFKQLSMQLYTGTFTNPINTVQKRNELLTQIRKQEGLEYFLLPKPYSELSKAAKSGPIVILSSHEDVCDAIIIHNPTANPVHLSLNPTPEKLASHKTMLKDLLDRCNVRRREESSAQRAGRREGSSKKPAEDCFKEVLDFLRTDIIDPIYDTLAVHGIHSGRLWWLPTGAFTGLPLHAACTDQFIHSYTLTLGSLLGKLERPKESTPKVGIVGVTHTGPEQNLLVGVGLEVQNLLAVIPKPYVESLEGSQATVDAVKHQLENCSWLHLACHGTQDLVEPTQSRLLLYGGELALETILKMPLPSREVVFLAACQTAMGDSQLVNESFHLGGGFIAAGFRGAIGTLWSMNDADGPVVAKSVYSHLFRDGRQPHAEDAAEALHIALKELKKGDVPYERWIPFIHIGV
ncbi:CHAT domain-containing protein [Mycena pura]|uniref:CHAT domain-containing protein n=1 Tax=Mycena pura TaxID=153505 RepID=A0AAD6UQT0_9AGAR|nr:CHAT domain-containing protein [Mycena pura]